MTTRNLQMLFITLAAILAFGACSTSESTTVVEDATASESQPAPAETDVQAQPASEIETDEAQPASDDAVDTSAPAPVGAAQGAERGLVTFGDEEFVFDMWQCGGFSDETFYASGLLLSDPNGGIELAVSYELPMLGDGDNAEYDNTLRLSFGNDSWKAGTLTNSVADQAWGTLDWTRDGDTLRGTATMEHSWGEGSENSEPRLASFQITC